MSELNIKDITYEVATEAVENFMTSLDTQVSSGKYKFLLAHADDGVIWGYADGSALKLSGAEFPHLSPQLRPETLWEARLFGENAEWHIWRTEEGWQSCTVTDGVGSPGRAFDERYILWGTDEAEPSINGFHPVREADLGIIHTPPVKMANRHTLKLAIRHYVAYDDGGSVYVKISRLTNLSSGGDQ
jgi:CRISPR-associated protein (TIGR03984 family)